MDDQKNNEATTETTSTIVTEDVSLPKGDNLQLAVAKLRAHAMIAYMDRQKRNFERDFIVVGNASQKVKNKLGEEHIAPVFKKNKDGSKQPVLIYQRAFWKQGKYTGEKLRQIRNEQTAKAVQGRTHFNDGTLINPSRLIDLAMVNSK